ncbi:MAG: nucleotidyltransferase family protein [Nitrospirales bacterium]
MILAAGLGTRLRPLTNSVPKPLLPVGGTPLIVWNLLLLRQYGIDDVIINLHYLGHMIQEALGNGARWGMHITYSQEPMILGTGGGLKAAESFFEEEDFLVLNSDTLIDVDLGNLRRFHMSRHARATMVLREYPQAEQWGVIETTQEDQVLTINGRGRHGLPSQEIVQKRMFAGVHVLNPQVLSHCPVGQASSIIDAYVTELEGGSSIMGYLDSGYWSDVGTPERYVQAQQDVDAGRLSLESRMLA